MSHSRFVLTLAVLLAAACSNDDNAKNGVPGGDSGVDMDAVLDMTSVPDSANPGDTTTPPDLGGDTATPGDMGTPGPDMADVDMGTTMLPSGICGNNVVETGETCDGCATLDCNDGSACTVDFLAGDPAACNAYCRNDAVTHCADGDGCCGAGCTAATDADCSSTCGNGTVDALETCDGNCPADCDDGDATTNDVMLGDAANCNVECVHLPILRCLDADGYCPAGCIAATDSDCEPACGNGVIEGNETCDPPESCPTCNDGNPCTTDATQGSAATCDVVCAATEILTCASGDGCCAARCTTANDNDCSATCGDGVVDNGETCDRPPSCNAVMCSPGACETAIRTGAHQSCSVDCGYVDITGCQDGDGCCPLGCTGANDNDCNARCGNGVIEPGEVCDPPGLCEIACPDDGDACTNVALVGDPSTCDARCETSPVTDCSLADGCCAAGCNANNDPDCVPSCGNGVVESGEICDGNCPNCNDSDACTIDTRAGIDANCNVTCSYSVITFCGANEGCCPQGVGCNALLDNDCPPVCGNGLVEPPETCDSNCPTTCADGDVCTTDVTTGTSGTCDLVCSNPQITACGAAEGCCPPGCNANNDPDCSPICGNSVVESGETCDGNCPASCDDGIACTADSRAGSSGSCNVVCTNTVITLCTGGDGCCPATCTNLNDSDCP